MKKSTAKNELNEWVTSAQAAKKLGVTSRRVLQLIEAGELEATKINPRLWMIRRDSVERYRAET